MKRSESRKWWVLAALSFGLLAVGLDITVLNVALPSLAAQLQATTGQLQWFADSYNLVLAAALLPAGMLGDRYGRKKLLLFSLLVFGLASAACAWSSSAEMLIAMRAILGLGAAFLIPLSMSVLPVMFEESERTKAMMIWAMANMMGIPLGPIVGGWLLKHYAWGSVFLINLPFVAVALIAVAILMPESRSEHRPRIDLLGIVTSSLGLLGVSYGVIRAGEHSWSDPASLAAFCGGLLLLAIFVLWQRRTRHPLIELSLFSSRSFTWGTLLATAVSFALFGLLFTMPQYYQAVVGADTLSTGLRLLPLIGGLIVGAKAADKLVTRIGNKINAASGFAVMAAGLFIGAYTTVDSSYIFTVAWMAAIGVGLGLAMPTSMNAALNNLTAERSGVGSALIMAMRQVGGSIGIALLGAALNASYRTQLELTNLPSAAADTVKQSVMAGIAVADKLGSTDLLQSVQGAFVHGMSLMLTICGGIAAASTILALLFLPRDTSAAQNAKVLAK